MKTTLIIHPKDSSTDFLKPIYSNIENKTVIDGSDGITKEEVYELIKEHDQVMMMGHGSPYGLFSLVDYFKYKKPTQTIIHINGKPTIYETTRSPYVIDSTTVKLLSEKTNNVFIWCNADMFVRKYGLKGFYSGMFVSEVSEALFCKLPGTTQDIVDESNNFFATELGKVIGSKPLNESFNYIKTVYGELSESNPVAYYNYNRLYLS